MNSNEHFIFQDIPSGTKKSSFHSAVLTTFAIDLIHFDSQMINQLRRKQICSINIFADKNQFDNSVELVSPNYLTHIGKDYSITGVKSNGAFHPKINFFAGDDSAMVLLGSGNLTITGHGKNHEAFSGFLVNSEDNTTLPLIVECWQYLCSIAKETGNYISHRIIDTIPENCPILKNAEPVENHKRHKIKEDLSAALLYPDEKSIFSQITELIPVNEIKTITIISPFYDQDGATLINFSESFPNAIIDVLMQNDCSLPPCKIKENENIHFYDFDKTSRGKIKINKYDRKLHAKIYHFKAESKEFCIIGSANATSAGLGTIKSTGINREFCVLYESTSINFLELLGLTEKKELEVDIHQIKPEEHKKSDNDSSEKTIYLKNAEYANGRLTVYTDEKSLDNLNLIIDNGVKTEIKNLGLIQGKITVEIELKDLCTCALSNSDGVIVSNHTFVNFLQKLELTNPSIENRNLNKIISKIENEDYNGLEITGFLSEIMSETMTEITETKSNPISSTFVDSKKEEKELPEIAYNKEYDNDDPGSRNTHKSSETASRLLTCIENSIKKKIHDIEDDLKGEEDTADAKESYNREIKVKRGVVVSKSKIKSTQDELKNLLENYANLLDKKNNVKEVDKMVISNSDFNFFSLIMFVSVEIAYLNKRLYTFSGDECYEDMTKPQKDSLFNFTEELNRTMQRSGLKAMCKFTKLVIDNNPLPKDDDVIKQKIQSTLKYALLFSRLLLDNATEDQTKVLEEKINLCLMNLCHYLGNAEDESIKELESISEKYDFAFRTENILKLRNNTNGLLKKLCISRKKGGKNSTKEINIYILDKIRGIYLSKNGGKQFVFVNN